MARTNEMETLLHEDNRQVAEEVLDFLDELNAREQREFMNFLQGARFVMTLNRRNHSEFLEGGERDC